MMYKYGTWRLADIHDPAEISWASMRGTHCAEFALLGRPETRYLAAFDNTGTELVAEYNDDTRVGGFHFGSHFTPKTVNAAGKFFRSAGLKFSRHRKRSGVVVEGEAGGLVSVHTGAPRLVRNGAPFGPEDRLRAASLESRIRQLVVNLEIPDDVPAWREVPECTLCAKGLDTCVPGHVEHWAELPQDIIGLAVRHMNPPSARVDRDVARGCVEQWLRRGVGLYWKGTY